MLNEIIDAVLAEERILIRLAKGELVEDKNGILRNKAGAYDALANEMHHQSLAAYVLYPQIFNLVEMITMASNPINAFRINRYIDLKYAHKELSC